MLRTLITGLLIATLFGVLGCDKGSSQPSFSYDPNQDDAMYSMPEDFNHNAETNTEVSQDLTTLEFVNVDGETVALKDHVGDKNVVLVVTRGGTETVCAYCSTQTSRLISRYQEIQNKDAEVVLVYPIAQKDDAAKLDAFLKATKDKLRDPGSEVPFPLVLDVDLQAVDKLDIRAQLSKPATYILDKKGKVRFAYVGTSVQDRPSVNAIIKHLGLISQDS